MLLIFRLVTIRKGTDLFSNQSLSFLQLVLGQGLGPGMSKNSHLPSTNLLESPPLQEHPHPQVNPKQADLARSNAARRPLRQALGAG